MDCPKCRKTEENAKEVVKELGIEAEVVHVYDQAQMIARGITSSPALAIDSELKIADRVPSKGDNRSKSCDNNTSHSLSLYWTFRGLYEWYVWNWRRNYKNTFA